MTDDNGGNMYCKNCGQFLTGNENFCSNCGAKVEAPAAPKTFPAFTSDKNGASNDAANVKKESVKVMSPVDDIVWDVKEFPTGEPKKTDDTEIRWRSEDMFLHKEIQREQEAFEKSMAEFMSAQEHKEAEKDSGLEVPDVFKDTASRESEAENKAPLEEEKDKSVVTRNTAPVMTELQTDDRIVDIKQPSGGGIAIEVVDAGDNGVKVEKVIVDEPQMTSVIADTEELVAEAEPVQPKETSAPSNAAVASADKTEPPGTLFDEIAPKAVETLKGANINEEKKQIDKFYTFNRKKEEFQKLLDKEYERIENKLEPGGFEEDIAGFMDVERGTAVEGTTQLEEMVKARTLFFDDPFFVPDDDEKTQDHIEDTVKEEEPEGIPVEELDGEKSKVVFEPQTEESLADVLAEQEQADIQEESPEVSADISDNEAEKGKKGSEENDAEPKAQETAPKETETAAEKVTEADEAAEEEEESADTAHIVIEPNVKPDEADPDDTEKLAREFFESDDEDEKKRMGKGSRILIWILSIIIIITAALLIVRIALPDTVISRQMDNVASKVVSIFTGGDDQTADTETVRDTLVEDKTGLIQLQIDKNYKEAIGTIKYNADAAYDENKDYDEATGLNDAKDIQSNLWYTDDSGKHYYYDEELVGAIIAFESQRVAFVNDGDKKVMSMIDTSGSIDEELNTEAKDDKNMDFSVLEIGDIKVAGNSYFVWVNETIDGKQSQKIYEFREKNKTLIVREVYDA